LTLLDLRVGATVTLGWSEDDFLAATPRIMLAAMERHREESRARERRWNERAGTLAAVTYKAQGVKRPGGGTWTAGDFFDVGDAEPYEGQTPEQQKAALMAWAAVFKRKGGDVCS